MQICPCCPCCPAVRTHPPSVQEAREKGGCVSWLKFILRWIIFVPAFPFVCLFSWTIPDCSKEHLKLVFVVAQPFWKHYLYSCFNVCVHACVRAYTHLFLFSIYPTCKFISPMSHLYRFIQAIISSVIFKSRSPVSLPPIDPTHTHTNTPYPL
jgi:hypothetical protein